MHPPRLPWLARPAGEGSAGPAEAMEFLSGLFVIYLRRDSWLPAESQKALGEAGKMMVCVSACLSRSWGFYFCFVFLNG